MDTPTQEMKAYDDLVGEAADLIAKDEWEAAKTALDQAIALDPVQVHGYDMLAKVYDGLHDPDQADHYRTQAKAIRQEQWQRQVEADVRGKHEMLGGPARHKIP